MFSAKLLPQITLRLVNCHTIIGQIVVKNRQFVDTRRVFIINRCLRTGVNGRDWRPTPDGKDEEVLTIERSPPVLNKQSVNSNNVLDIMAITGREVDDRHIDALSEDIDPEVLDELSPALVHSFNLAAFAEKSATLQTLVKLGVNLSLIERKSPQTAQNVLKLDFESDIKPYVQWLVDSGVPPSQLGLLLTKNPRLLSQHIDDLNVRLNYLRSKRFTQHMIAEIIIKAPKLLNISTKGIDHNLGFIQKEFHLTADELRNVVMSDARIALLHNMSYRKLTFAFKEEFGFNSHEIKHMLMRFASLFYSIAINERRHRKCVQIFDLIHNEMKIPHELIYKFPQILDRHYGIIEERHLYLNTLGRAQYESKLPLYVPLSAFCELDDIQFCDKIAKTNVHDFNAFCKTL